MAACNPCTWNVQGCRNKMEEILREINVMKMDVVVLTETKKKVNRKRNIGKLYTLFSGVKKYKRAKRAVTVLHTQSKKYN
jgi:exonuclease III